MVPDAQFSTGFALVGGQADMHVPLEQTLLPHALRLVSTRQPLAFGAHVTAAFTSQ
jgi:hypothetical protein